MKFLLVFLVLLPCVLGVTIHGTVYDFGLNKMSNALVEIDSSPRQFVVAVNGTYSFSVPPGDYVLRARDAKSDSEAAENISAVSEGDYVFDLILLPSFEEELLFEDTEVPFVEDVVQDKPASQWFLWLIVFAVLGYVVHKVSRKPAKEMIKEVAVVDELQKILDFIDSEGGRATQKDIRKIFPYSEAKVSLMIDELVSKGLIKKVKKGRGNIILRE